MPIALLCVPAGVYNMHNTELVDLMGEAIGSAKMGVRHICCLVGGKAEWVVDGAAMASLGGINWCFSPIHMLEQHHATTQQRSCPQPEAVDPM